MSRTASSAQRVVRDAVRDKQFAPAYYLFGEDDFLKEQAVRQLVEAAVDPATRDFNLEVRRGAEIDAETLGSLLGTPPMMAERRVLVVRDVGALRKDARTLLDRYLRSPARDAVVVLVAPAGARMDKGLAGKTTALEFEPLTGDRVPKWIKHHAEKELGAESITPEAVALLQSAVGGDLPQLAIELDKLASYTGGGTIDEAAVAAIVGVRRGETLGSFLDAVGARDVATALELLPIVMAQPKTSGVMVVMALTVQTLAVGWARARRARGVPPGQLVGELWGLLKEGGSVYTGRPWGEAVDAWVRAARQDADDPDGGVLDAALDALLAADFALKETRLSSEEQVLTNLVLTLCAGPGEYGRARLVTRGLAASS